MTPSGPPATEAERSGHPAGLWELFPASAARHSRAVAVADPTSSFTYHEAHERAAAFASALAQAGVGSGDTVAVCFDRTADAVMGPLAVLSLGGTVLPIEVDCPPVRLEAILDSARPKVALGDELGVSLLRNTPVPCIDSRTVRSAHGAGTAGPGSAEVAYLLYTSGSTGSPKGVEVEHANVVALLEGVSRWETSTTEDVWACLTAFSFDVSLWELWRPLSVGAQVFVMPRSATVDVAQLMNLLEAHHVTSLCLTPTAVRVLAETGGSAAFPSEVRRVFVAGERLEFAVLQPFADRVAAGTLEIWNMYGPTETTVYSTRHQITGADILTERRSIIGRALDSVNVEVVDADETGVGELVVSGPGVTRGYRGDPGRTAESFGTRLDGRRFYRTGDLARDLGEGNFEFVGRRGGYVKVRGYRVELEEVATALRSHPAVSAAVAQVVDDRTVGETIVCAVVCRRGYSLDGVELRRHTARRLPMYMRPSRIVFLDTLPLLPSYKIDEVAVRRALTDHASSAP
jgi:amino acid adenylation domain-containing protein